MQSLPGTSLVTASAPVVSFDHKSPFARFYLLAALTWPKDRMNQGYALVTFAMQLKAYVKRRGVRAIAEGEFSTTIAEAARELGVLPEAVLSMPMAREIARSIIQDVGNAPGRIESELFDPAGGDQAGADAPGSRVIREAIQRAINGPAKNAGYALLLVARLHHTSTVAPSLNRVLAIMETTCTGPNWTGTAERTLKEHWKGWSSIAPLSAAIWVWISQRPHLTGEEDWMVEAFTTEIGVKSVMRWAKWFRRFGTTFRPKGGQGPLISPTDAIDFDVELPEQAPILHALSSSELAAAHAYHAPTLKP